MLGGMLCRPYLLSAPALRSWTLTSDLEKHPKCIHKYCVQSDGVCYKGGERTHTHTVCRNIVGQEGRLSTLLPLCSLEGS